jgi:hypothetical protein
VLTELSTVTIGFLLDLGEKSDEGRLILAVTPAWLEILSELERDSEAFAKLTWRQFEELIGGGYKEDGWDLTILTPRSGDKGRDIVATTSDVGTIRIIDQVSDRLPFAALEPAGQDPQQHLESRGGDHKREPISQPSILARYNSSIELWDRTGCRRAVCGRRQLFCSCHSVRRGQRSQPRPRGLRGSRTEKLSPAKAY